MQDHEVDILSHSVYLAAKQKFSVSIPIEIEKRIQHELYLASFWALSNKYLPSLH